LKRFASLSLLKKASRRLACFQKKLGSLPFLLKKRGSEEKRKRRKEEAKKKGRAIDKADDTICQQFLRAIFYYI